MVSGAPVAGAIVSVVIGGSYRKDRKDGAPGRSRTGTPLSRQRILSPQRLPISPPGQGDNGNTLTNAAGGVTFPVAQSSLHRCEAGKALINGSEPRSDRPLSIPRRISLP